jgi:hypothetical protein
MHVVVSVSPAELAARLDAIETPEQGASLGNEHPRQKSPVGRDL